MNDYGREEKLKIEQIRVILVGKESNLYSSSIRLAFPLFNIPNALTALNGAEWQTGHHTFFKGWSEDQAFARGDSYYKFLRII